MLLLSLFQAGAQTSYWEPAPGLYGGEITSLAIDTHGHLFAMDSRGKLYRSTNSGTLWSRTLLPERNWSRVISDSSLGLFVLESDTVLRSTDEGESWNLAGAAITSLTSIAGTHTGSILAGRSAGGVYRWRPQDANWVLSGLAGEDVRRLFVNPWLGVIAATTKRIFRSSNGGVTWDTLATAVPSTNYSCWIDSSGTLFAGHEISGLKYSTNRGVTWTVSGLKSPLTVRTITGPRPREMYAGISPLDATVPGGVLKTTDGGATWKSLGLTEWAINTLLVTGPGRLFVGTFRGVLSSTDDGATWTQASDGIRGVQVSAIMAVDSTLLFVGGSGALFRSTNGGEKWTESGTGITCPGVTSLASDGEDNLFAGTPVFSPLGGVHKSTDRGVTWRCTSQDTIKGLYMSVQVLSVTQSGYVLAAVEGKTYRSTDRGETWTTVRSIRNAKRIEAFTSDPSGQIFGVTWGDGALRSTDEGGTWLFTSANLPSPNLRCVVTRAPGELFVGGLKGVSRSTNSGDTWADISSGLAQPSIRALAFDKNNGLLASTTTGKVYRTTNNGANWMDVTNGLPAFQVVSFAIASRSLIFASTDTAGLYRANTLTLSVEAQPFPAPTRFTLSQNYPNPFNPSTTIRYGLPVPARVRLSVFDVVGREVVVLVDERKDAGSYEVRFDARAPAGQASGRSLHLASGVYFYRFSAGAYSETRPMVLMK
jgi:photosystem II stability/assembly factor-like uncharacterized protein